MRWLDDGSRFPDSVVGFSNRVGRGDNFHPTQKPLALMNFLVNSYTVAGGALIDNCMGSGTTGVAAIQLGRKFTGIEREPKYFDIACKRIEQAYAQGQLFEPIREKQVQETFL
jgi:DNA modification methylase